MTFLLKKTKLLFRMILFINLCINEDRPQRASLVLSQKLLLMICNNKIIVHSKGEIFIN